MWPFNSKARWHEWHAERVTQQNEIAVLKAEVATLQAINKRLEMRAADNATFKETIARMQEVMAQVNALVAPEIAAIYRDEK